MVLVVSVVLVVSSVKKRATPLPNNYLLILVGEQIREDLALGKKDICCLCPGGDTALSSKCYSPRWSWSATA